jgi:hypothetical protein
MGEARAGPKKHPECEIFEDDLKIVNSNLLSCSNEKSCFAGKSRKHNTVCILLKKKWNQKQEVYVCNCTAHYTYNSNTKQTWFALIFV